MITCESACPHRIPWENTASPVTGLRWPQSPSRSVRRCSSTARKPFATRIPASTRRLPAIRTPSTTRSRPTPRWRCCACCEAWAAAPTPTPAARFGWRSAPASRPPISFSPAWARRARSSSSPSPRTWARSTPSRRASSIASRRSPGRSGARHAWRCASIPTSTPGLTRTSPPACASTSSASRSRTPAASIARAATLPGLRFTGVHVHIGSQITSAEPLQRAAEALAGIALQLRDDGVPLEHVDLGGGLGIPYEGKPMIAPSEYAAAVLPALRRCGLPVVLEPGRAIVGRSGALVVAHRGHQAEPRRAALRRARRRHDRADAARALRFVSPHRAGAAARRSRSAPGTSSARSARAATPSAASASCRRSKWATWWPCSIPAPTAPSWGPTTTAGCWRLKCSSTGASGRVIRRRQTLDDVLALES